MTRAEKERWTNEGGRAGSKDAPSAGTAHRPDSEAAGADSPIVGQITADRLCTHCGYNLVGQPIVRESKYGLLVTRCSECGTYSAPTEYPSLAAGLARLTMLFAAAWLLIISAAVLLTGLALFGLSQFVAWSMLEPARQLAQGEFQASILAAGGDASKLWQSTGADAQRWLDSVGGEQGFLDAHGGWRVFADWSVWIQFLPAVIGVFLIGVVWAALTMGVPRRRLWIVPIPPIIFGAVLATLNIMWGSVRYGNTWYTIVVEFLNRRYERPLTTIAFITFAVFLFVGLRVGRPIVRMVVSILLPPRLRSGLAFLWTSDGLMPPKM